MFMMEKEFLEIVEEETKKYLLQENFLLESKPVRRSVARYIRGQDPDDFNVETILKLLDDVADEKPHDIAAINRMKKNISDHADIFHRLKKAVVEGYVTFDIDVLIPSTQIHLKTTAKNITEFLATDVGRKLSSSQKEKCEDAVRAIVGGYDFLAAGDTRLLRGVIAGAVPQLLAAGGALASAVAGSVLIFHIDPGGYIEVLLANPPPPSGADWADRVAQVQAADPTTQAPQQTKIQRENEKYVRKFVDDLSEKFPHHTLKITDLWESGVDVPEDRKLDSPHYQALAADVVPTPPLTNKHIAQFFV